jgi:hypothetical protein
MPSPPPLPSRQPSSKAARVSAGTLVLQEKAARKDLYDAVDEAVDSLVADMARKPRVGHRTALLLLVLGAGSALQRKLAASLAEHRQAARAAAANRLHAELRAAGISIDRRAMEYVAARAAVDAAHAEGAAASLAAAWQSSAVAAVRKHPDESTPYRAIDKTRAAAKPRLDRTARNEIASAYNEEHAQALRDLAEHDAALAAALEAAQVVRVWDAILDRRTCSACDARHGEVIEPGDVDPPLHVGCRCIAILEPRAARAAA